METASAFPAKTKGIAKSIALEKTKNRSWKSFDPLYSQWMPMDTNQKAFSSNIVFLWYPTDTILRVTEM